MGALATGAGVSYALVSHRATRQSVVSCYAEARLDAGAVEVTGSGADPVAACRGVWAAGHIPGRPAVTDQTLTACVLPSGLAGVFPDAAGGACGRLHLTPIDVPLRPTGDPGTGTTATPSQTPVTGMMTEVAARLAGTCLTADQAKQMVRSILDRTGLAAWKVTQPALFTADRPCASPGFDEINHQVFIIPIPR